MIRSICLNPNIDRTYRIEGFVPGKQYKRIVPEITAGGKGVNVAKACSCLGERTVLYCFTAGTNGRALISEMSKYCDMIRNIEIEGNTRETINIIDRTSSQETEIVEKGPSITDVQFSQFFHLLETEICEDDIVVCSGASIEGAPDDVYVRISELCRQKKALCILDTNGKVLKNSVYGHYAMWKPNQNELAEIADAVPSCRPEDIISRIRSLKQLDCSSVIVSLGIHGGMLVTENATFIASVPDVPVVSTIGCGDCVVAGYAVALKNRLSIESSLRYAMACGVINSASKGIAVIDRHKVEAVQSQIEIKEI